MEINVPNDPVQLDDSNLRIVLDDKGSALVEMTLAIDNLDPIKHDQTYYGPKTAKLTLPRGEHKCTAVVSAYYYGKALGPVYNATFKINDVEVATTEGAIDSGHPAESNFANFTLIVA